MDYSLAVTVTILSLVMPFVGIGLVGFYTGFSAGIKTRTQLKTIEEYLNDNPNSKITKFVDSNINKSSKKDSEKK